MFFFALKSKVLRYTCANTHSILSSSFHRLRIWTRFVCSSSYTTLFIWAKTSVFNVSSNYNWNPPRESQIIRNSSKDNNNSNMSPELNFLLKWRLFPNSQIMNSQSLILQNIFSTHLFWWGTRILIRIPIQIRQCRLQTSFSAACE